MTTSINVLFFYQNKYDTVNSHFAKHMTIPFSSLNNDAVTHCMEKYFGEDIDQEGIDDALENGSFGNDLWCDNGEEYEVIIFKLP